ncbi:MAG: sodium/proline symporter [Pseudomonadota bacterium]|uniref:sodium/proline symporter n=1 Tax=Methylophaga aminisulfidivorans TaxID=230105 RepID=UPI0024E22448|nr:sodium/proline symporter [Methylophaga aminisulfidivorans]MEC9413267.1 sodium/proline symporter [Pseudomonadota bacterium]
MIWSFLGFLAIFVAIGVSSVFFSRGTKKDYYLASSDIPPSLVGLSAVATNNSGYMFIGVIGYTYATGLASIWIMIGWILGDLIASTFVHSRLRRATSDSAEPSYAGVLSNWYGQNDIVLQRLIALISLVLLLAYAGAQLVAGSKALHVLFGWPTYTGAIIGAIMVTLYCFAGGIRASIWTDAAQSVVMIVAMSLMLFIAVTTLGGPSAAIVEMDKVDGFLNLFPQDLVIPGLTGGVLFALSWMFAGFSVIGQPHVMIRFMALSHGNKMMRARLWYYSWFTAFYCLATGVGMLSRVYLGDAGSFDAELALPRMAMELLPPALVGLVLAGVFAATMSTADSLVLNCSAAVTHDLLPHNIENTLILKLSTIGIVTVALLWALTSSESVFSLVIFAWSGLASAFAPLLITLCMGFRPSQRLSIIAMLIGLSVALLWRYFGLHNAVYEGLPGIMSGLLILAAGLVWKKKTVGTTHRVVSDSSS